MEVSKNKKGKVSDTGHTAGRTGLGRKSEGKILLGQKNVELKVKELHGSRDIQ